MRFRWTMPGAGAAWAMAVLLALGGCSGRQPGATPQSADAAAGAGAAEASVIAVEDPFEGFNRRIYQFNALADRYVLLPVVDAYVYVVPLVLRDRVSDFFANIGNLITFGNQVLQLKFGEAAKTALRFGANSTFGMFGLVDIASAMGMPKYQEDFGQTLGYWGVGEGAYLVLPILGPSNVRDTVGMATDAAAFVVVDPFTLSTLQSRYPPVMVLNGIDSRYQQSFRYYESGSPFEYDLVRFFYTKKRQVEVGIGPFGGPGAGEHHDGQP